MGPCSCCVSALKTPCPTRENALLTLTPGLTYSAWCCPQAARARSVQMGPQLLTPRATRWRLTASSSRKVSPAPLQLARRRAGTASRPRVTREAASAARMRMTTAGRRRAVRARRQQGPIGAAARPAACSDALVEIRPLAALPVPTGLRLLLFACLRRERGAAKSPAPMELTMAPNRSPQAARRTRRRARWPEARSRRAIGASSSPGRGPARASPVRLLAPPLNRCPLRPPPRGAAAQQRGLPWADGRAFPM